MRSSFRAPFIRQVALSLFIVSSFGLNVAANADGQAGTVHLKQLLIAQGDASLPPPDPSYHPRSRFDAAASNASNSGDQSDDDIKMRRRMRRRMNAGINGAGGGVNGPGGFNAGGNGLNALGNGPNAPGGFAAAGSGFNAGGGFNAAGGALNGAASTNVRAGLGGGGRGGQGLGRFNNGFGGGGGGGANLFGRKALDLTSLSLTPDQKQKIQDMRSQVAPKTRELRKQLVAKRAELRDMMFEANAGDDQVRAKRKEVRQLQDKIEDMQLNDFLGIRSVLTPDQRQKLTDLKPGTPGSKFTARSGTELVAPVVSTP